MKAYRFGVCEWSLPIPGPYGVRMAGEAGFGGMQLGDGGGSKKAFPLCNERIQQAYLEAAVAYGVEFASMHLYTLFRQRSALFPANSAEGEHARLSIDKAFEACKKLGVPGIMITITRYREPEARRNAVECLRYALKKGADAGIAVALETDLLPNEIAALREEIGPALRICFDTMNPMVYGIGEPWELIRQLGADAIDHVHVKDCDKEGLTGFEKTAAAIKDMGKICWLISEVYYDVPSLNQGRDYVELAKKDAATLKKLFGSPAK